MNNNKFIIIGITKNLLMYFYPTFFITRHDDELDLSNINVPEKQTNINLSISS